MLAGDTDNSSYSGAAKKFMDSICAQGLGGKSAAQNDAPRRQAEVVDIHVGVRRRLCNTRGTEQVRLLS